jgi:ankyrin repeat protein
MGFMMREVVVNTYLLVPLTVLSLVLSSCSREKVSAQWLFPDKKAQALAEAVVSGDTKAINASIEKGADVDYVGRDGITPLAWAMIKGSKVGYEFLLKNGANPNASAGDDDTLLFMALDVDDPFYLETALKYGGNPNQRKPWVDGDVSLLWNAVFKVKPVPDKIRILVKYGANVQEQDNGGVVSTCAMMNHYEDAYIFLEAGATFSTNREPSSLLERLENRAVHPNDPEYEWRDKVVEFLRERGIEVTPKEWTRKDQPTIINIQTNMNIPRK